MGPRHGQGRLEELGRTFEGLPEAGRDCSAVASTSLASPAVHRRLFRTHSEGRLHFGTCRCLRLRQDGGPYPGYHHHITLICLKPCLIRLTLRFMFVGWYICRRARARVYRIRAHARRYVRV